MSSLADGRAAYLARHPQAAPAPAPTLARPTAGQSGAPEGADTVPAGGGLIDHVTRGRMRHRAAHGRPDERAAVAEALRAHDELVAALREQGTAGGGGAGGRP